MVFWSKLKKKIKDIISRTEFDNLKQQVDQNTEDIVFCAKTSQNNVFDETNTFTGTTNLTIATANNLALQVGTIENEPENENDIVNKKYVDSKSGIKVYTKNFQTQWKGQDDTFYEIDISDFEYNNIISFNLTVVDSLSNENSIYFGGFNNVEYSSDNKFTFLWISINKDTKKLKLQLYSSGQGTTIVSPNVENYLNIFYI